MEEPNLKNITDWLELNNEYEYKLFRRDVDDSIIICVRTKGNIKVDVQADLKFALTEWLKIDM